MKQHHKLMSPAPTPARPSRLTRSPGNILKFWLLLGLFVLTSLACSGLDFGLDRSESAMNTEPTVPTIVETEEAATEPAATATPVEAAFSSEKATTEPSTSEVSPTEESTSEPDAPGQGDIPKITIPEIEIPEINIPDVNVPELDVPTPVTSSVEVLSCEAQWEDLLARFEGDYARCDQAEAALNDTCQRPDNLQADNDLKENINIQLILDSSGSMAGQVGGRSKIDVAKEVLIDFVDTLPETAKVALRVYGHTGSNNEADKAVSCAGTELLYPFETVDQDQFRAAIDAFQPTGWTPIADSLAQAQADFTQFDPATSSNFIYLVSDGIETCDGNPIAAAQALHESDIQAVVNIVGFDVDAEAAQQLKAAAEAGGGQYYEARSANDLEEIFRETVNWREWANYHTCKWQTYINYANQTSVTEINRSNCVSTTAFNEHNQISQEVFNNRDRYAACRDELLDQARSRRDEIIGAARAERNATIEAARSERDQAIDESRQERDEALDRD